VNLTGVGRSGRVMEWKAGPGTTLAPVEWDLETLDANVTLEQIASGGAPRGLLAWIALRINGNEPATIQRWLEVAGSEGDPFRKADSALVVVFAQLTGGERVWKKALEGFNVIESVIVNEWKAEATIKSKIDDLVKLVEARFGPVPADAKAKIESTNSPALLQQWILLAGKANSLDDFRRDAGV
jgi:hypothetical protein